MIAQSEIWSAAVNRGTNVEKKTRVPADYRKLERFTHFSTLKFVRAFLTRFRGNRSRITTAGSKSPQNLRFRRRRKGRTAPDWDPASRILPPANRNIRHSYAHRGQPPYRASPINPLR